MKKRVIALFICLFIVCTLLVLNATLFVVNDVVVCDWVEQGDLDKQQIADLSGVKGRNIFTVSEKIAKDNIEKAIPEIKVVNVERSFPSSVKITVLKRVPIIAVKCSDGYAIIDREANVIKKSSTPDGYDYQLTIFEGVDITNVLAGERLSLDDTQYARLIQIITTFETTGEGGYRDANFCKTVSKIKFVGDYVYINMAEGMTLRLDASIDCTNKVRSLISFFNNGTIDGTPIDRTQGTYTTGEKGSNGGYQILKVIE